MKQNIRISIFMILLIFMSIFISYGNEKENNEVSLKDLNLNSIYYDDENYLYFKMDKYMGRLTKDFTGEFELQSDSEKRSIIELLQRKDDSKRIDGLQIDSREIEIRDKYLYINDTELLNIEKYVDMDNKFYDDNPEYKREPIDFYIDKYTINNGKSIYSIRIYTSMVIPPPYTPWSQRYILMEDGSIEELKFPKGIAYNGEQYSEERELVDEKYVVRNIYYNEDDSIWVDGYHYMNRHTSFNKIYHIDSKGHIAEANKKIEELIKDKNKITQIKLIGINDGNIVVATTDNGFNDFDKEFIVSGFYEVNSALEVKKRSEDASLLKEKYTLVDGSSSLYLGKDNKIYYLSDNIKGVVNLTDNKFKYYDRDSEGKSYKLGDKIGSFMKSNAVVTIGRSHEHYVIKEIPVYNIDEDLAICIEDLQYYGYEMIWDSENRITSLKYIEEEAVGVSGHKKDAGNIIYSDVDVYVDDVKVPGYNIGGYTLVKIEELKKLDNMIFYREYDKERKNFHLQGKIKLPHGDVAPAGGIKGKVVVYGYGYKTKPVAVMEKDFTIPEGESYIEYQIGNNDKMDTEEFMYDDINSYEGKQVGYLIDDKYGYINGSIYNKEGRIPEGYTIFLKQIKDFKVNYDNFDIDIFGKVNLSGVIMLQGKVEHLNYKDIKREIVISAVEEEGGEFFPSITKNIMVSQDLQKIEYDMDLIADKKYALRYKITLCGAYPNPYELSVGSPILINDGFYKRGEFVDHFSQAEIIAVNNKDINNINIEIPIPIGIKLGKAAYSDIKTYLNGEEITRVDIDGHTAIAVNDFNGIGFSVKYKGEKKRVEIVNNKTIKENKKIDLIQADENLKLGDEIGDVFYTDIKTFINNREVASYNYKGYTFVLVKELKDLGFEVNYDSVKRELNIKSN